MRFYSGSRQQQQFMVQAMLQVIDRYTRDRTINVNNVMAGIKIIIVPIMQQILSKYSEPDFHRVMSGTYVDESGSVAHGFDFLADWRNNHRMAYNAGLMVARNFGPQLNFNIDVTTNMMVEIMNSWGWYVSYRERMSIRHNLVRIKRLLGFRV